MITRFSRKTVYHNYNSGWWNTWSVEATKTVAKYERVGEPQRMRLLNHTSNAHCALPSFILSAERSLKFSLFSVFPLSTKLSGTG